MPKNIQRSNTICILIALQLLSAPCAWGQQLALRKKMQKQQERNAQYSDRASVLIKHYQIGNLIRTEVHDSLATAKGMNSWLYSLGTGVVAPMFGPLWMHLDVDYQCRNFKMRSDEKSLLAPVEKLQKHKIVLHTVAASAYLRWSTSRNKPLQGKYIEIGYSYGYNFANRLLVFQGVDPATGLGANHSKTKYKNTTVFAKSAQHLCVQMGREKIALFAEYRISQFFRRSPYIRHNQDLAELSRWYFGLTFLINSDTDTKNTDEDETTE